MIRLVGAACVLVFVCACQHPRVVRLPAPPPPPPPQDVVILLSDPETQTVGRAVVSSALGSSVELTTERAATRAVIGQPPIAPFTISEAEVQQLVGGALAARPLAPRQFLLYFDSGSNHLLPQSENLLKEIVAFVKSRPVPDVTVVGHTD